MSEVGVRRGPLGRLSPLARACIRYFGRTRDPYVVAVLLLHEEVEAELEAATEDLFAAVEAELERAVDDGDLEIAPGARAVTFDYDTRLLLPAMLTLGRLHEVAGDVPLVRRVRGVDEGLVNRARTTTRHVVRALLDGDMRDALNDEEYADFDTTIRPRERAAELAQATLQSGVEAWFDDPATPEAVETHYMHAVGLSETHQERDHEFRELLARYHTNAATGGVGGVEGAGEGDVEGAGETPAEAIRERYKFADPIEPPALFSAETGLPYFATQYERVGVLYEAMLGMYEADLGVALGDSFKRSIVLMVIAAQVGLDDVDDYPQDRREQLTPVTAELAINGPDGLENVREIVLTYADHAAGYSSNHLTGMAIEYIRQDALDRIDALATEVRTNGC